MKKILTFAVILILVSSCQKGTHVPAEYVGTWMAESAQFLATANRIHTLTITNGNKGAKGQYTSVGNTKLWDEDVDGNVKIEGNVLKVSGKEFEIVEAPHQNADGQTEMKLGTLLFTKL